MAYMSPLPDRCQRCSSVATHRVYSSFSSTTILDGFYCNNHASVRVRELNSEEEQRQAVSQLDAQDLVPRSRYATDAEARAAATRVIAKHDDVLKRLASQ